jgi:phosphate transport system substrate-binding protein
MRKATWLARILASVAVLALVASACGEETTPPANGGGTPLEGSLNISGSSTVEPITSLVAEKFQSANPGVTVAVDGPGTSDGFELFCNGETDISDASRQIEPEEASACEANGIQYVELEVGQDALSVIGNPSNPISCLTMGDLYALFGPESSNFKTWADANSLAQDVGGEGGFPNAPLTIVAPGEESGTYGSFIDLVGTEDVALERGVSENQAGSLATYQISADDNVIVENAAGTQSGLGFVGYAFASNAGDSVKEFQIDAGDGCVSPSPETVQDGTYPLSRSLYIYVNTSKLAENHALQPFVDFYLTDEGIASTTEVGYVALPTDRLEASRSAWDASMA